MEKYDPTKINLAEVLILRLSAPFDEDNAALLRFPPLDIDPKRLMGTRTDSEIVDEEVHATVYLTLAPARYLVHLEEKAEEEKARAWNEENDPGYSE